jgi:hypothetical protein
MPGEKKAGYQQQEVIIMADFPADTHDDVKRLSEQIERAGQSTSEQFQRMAEQIEALRKDHERLLKDVAFIKSKMPTSLLVP